VVEHDLFERRLTDALRAYAAEVPTEVRPMELAASIATGHPRRPTAWWALGRPMRPIAVLLILVALLLAGAVAIVAIGDFLEADPIVRIEPQVARPDLRPTPDGDDPVGLASVGIGGWNDVVVDRDGVAWAWGPRSISRYDPATGASRVYGWDDDPRFVSSRPIAAADQGGVWLATGGELLRLDGEGIREVRPEPADGCGVRAGSILVVCDGTFFVPDGAAWRGITTPFSGEIRHASIGPGDVVWVLDDADTLWRGTPSGWVAEPLPVARGWDVYGLLASSDGSLWVAGVGGFDRLIEGAWRHYGSDEFGTLDLYDIVESPDGTIWGIGIEPATSYPPGDRIIAVRYIDDRFTRHEVPIAPGTGFGSGPSIGASAAAVYATVWGALARFDGTGFTLLDPGPPRRFESVSSIAVDGSGRAYVVAGEPGTELDPIVGRPTDGGLEQLDGVAAGGVRVGPDGSVWTLSSDGPMRYTGERFETIGPPLDLASDHLGWLPPFAIGSDLMPYVAVGRDCAEDQDGTIVCDGGDERVAHLEGGAWIDLPAHPGQTAGIKRLEVAPDRSVWVITGADADTAGLARYRDGGWQAVDLPAIGVSQVVGIAPEADGRVWVTFRTQELPDDEWVKVVGRLSDGEWTLFDLVEGEAMTGGRGGSHGDLIVGRDGTVWTIAREGIARFDGERWAWAVKDMPGLAHLTLGADGSIWAAGNGVHRLVKADG
jgi:hypothetical protein